MQKQTATSKKQERPRRVFGAADTLGMLTAIIGECRAAGLVVTTRNDDAAGSWVIEVKNAHQFKTDEGLRVDVRPVPTLSVVVAAAQAIKPEGKVSDGQ